MIDIGPKDLDDISGSVDRGGRLLTPRRIIAGLVAGGVVLAAGGSVVYVRKQQDAAGITAAGLDYYLWGKQPHSTPLIPNGSVGMKTGKVIGSDEPPICTVISKAEKTPDDTDVLTMQVIDNETGLTNEEVGLTPATYVDQFPECVGEGLSKAPDYAKKLATMALDLGFTGVTTVDGRVMVGKNDFCKTYIGTEDGKTAFTVTEHRGRSIPTGRDNSPTPQTVVAALDTCS